MLPRPATRQARAQARATPRPSNHHAIPGPSCRASFHAAVSRAFSQCHRNVNGCSPRGNPRFPRGNFSAPGGEHGLSPRSHGVGSLRSVELALRARSGGFTFGKHGAHARMTAPLYTPADDVHVHVHEEVGVRQKLVSLAVGVLVASVLALPATAGPGKGARHPIPAACK